MPSESEVAILRGSGRIRGAPLFIRSGITNFENGTASLQYEQERTGCFLAFIGRFYPCLCFIADALMQYIVSEGARESVFEINVGDEIAPTMLQED